MKILSPEVRIIVMRLKVVHLVLQKYALLFDSKHSKIENADVKEIYEVINHKYALNKVLERIDKKIRILDENFLTEFNHTINHNIINPYLHSEPVNSIIDVR